MTTRHTSGRTAAAPSQITLVDGGRSYTVQVRDGQALLPKGLAVETIGGTARRGRTVRRPGPAKVSLRQAGAAPYGADATAARLVAVLGNNTVADLLGVTRDRPGRWAKGEGAPDAVNRVALADLDGLVGQLLAAFTPEQASLWLVGDNAHLGARPLEVYRLHGSAPVLQAVAAHEQGAFAQVDLWRVCVWRPGETDSTVNGHPLYVWPRQGAGRVDDPAGEYLVLYGGDSAAGAVAEYLGNYVRWTGAVLVPPPAAPADSKVALAHLTGDADVLDLDDPYVLVEQGLRPSAVVTRDRGITQRWARAIYSAGRHAGVAWWSYRDPRWTSLGLWDQRALSVAAEPVVLTLDHPAVIEASQIIGRVID